VYKEYYIILSVGINSIHSIDILSIFVIGFKLFTNIAGLQLKLNDVLHRPTWWPVAQKQAVTMTDEDK